MAGMAHTPDDNSSTGDQAPKVALYVSQWCGYCRAAKALLSREGIAFDEIDVGNDQAARQAVVARSGWRTVPVIYIGDELVGGYTELDALHRRGGLQRLKATPS